MQALFWISVSAIVYTYLVYPVIIIFWGTVLRRRVNRRYRQVPLSVVLVVRDEESNIASRIENFRAQDYPRELVEIIVVSDGSTDRTAAVARECGDDIVVIETEPMGKSGALNHGVQAASNGIIVFADARQRFSENVFAELVAFLHDETVGAVSGELIIRPLDGSEVGEGVGLYWEYEKLIRKMESRAQSVVGATGSIYAVRKRLFEPLAPHTLLDDFLVPMRIVLAGYRVVFARNALAFDTSSASSSKEFARKVRTLAGNFQAFAMEKRLLNPARNPVFFQLVSHKLARLLVPYFCIAALVSSLLLDTAGYRFAFVAQVVFYGVGLLNFTVVRNSRMGKLPRVVWTFVVLNAAAVAGFWVWLTGRDRTVWKKTA